MVKFWQVSNFAEIDDFIQLWTIFPKHFILGNSQGYEYASDKTKQNFGAFCHLFDKKLLLQSL